MTESELKILSKVWLKNNQLKKGDKVYVSRNMSRETDYSRDCWSNIHESLKGQIITVDDIVTTQSHPLPAVSFKDVNGDNRYFSFNWVSKI